MVLDNKSELNGKNKFLWRNQNKLNNDFNNNNKTWSKNLHQNSKNHNYELHDIRKHS